MKTIKIGALFNLLATIEAEKGKAKLAKDNVDKAQGQFIELARGEDSIFVSETEQKLASVKYQTRAALNVELLLKAGVHPDVIKLATVESAPFAVFRIH